MSSLDAPRFWADGQFWRRQTFNRDNCPFMHGNDHKLSDLPLQVLYARRRIAPYVRRTPLVESSWLTNLTGARVRLKLESTQVSNSFKSRGAFNAVLARIE